MARKSQTFSEYAAERGIKVTPDFTIDRRGNFHYPLKDEEQSRRQRKALADYRKWSNPGPSTIQLLSAQQKRENRGRRKSYR